MNMTRTHCSYADDANMTVKQLRARCNDFCADLGGNEVSDLLDEIRSKSPNMVLYRITDPDAAVYFHEYWSETCLSCSPLGADCIVWLDRHPLLASYWDSEEITRRGCEDDPPFQTRSDGSVMFKCTGPIDELIRQIGDGVDWSTLEKVEDEQDFEYESVMSELDSLLCPELESLRRMYEAARAARIELDAMLAGLTSM